MIEVLQLGRVHGQSALRQAIETALALGTLDAAAVRHLVAQPQLERAPQPQLEVGPLARFERPLPSPEPPLLNYKAGLPVRPIE